MQYTPLLMTFDEMYEAVLENNQSYDSIFFYAVKSTGIYCRPSCKSKAPKKENVEFFTRAHEAQVAGYRACKRCRSDLLDYKPMQDMAKKLKKLINASFVETASLHAEMDSMGLSRKRMVEIFKEEYGITPSQYMNNLRYGEAQKLLTQSNNEIIDIAYSVGFGSLSAFYKFFKERSGLSPAAYRKINSNSKFKLR